MKVDKKELYQQLAHKYNLSVKEIEKAVNSQFAFVNNMIRNGEQANTRIPFFGLFEERFRNIEKQQEYRKKINEDTEARRTPVRHGGDERPSSTETESEDD